MKDLQLKFLVLLAALAIPFAHTYANDQDVLVQDDNVTQIGRAERIEHRNEFKREEFRVRRVEVLRELRGRSEVSYQRAFEAKIEEKEQVYPKGVDPEARPYAHLKFGFESEYALSESQAILEAYGPREEFGISKEMWLHEMTAEQRTAWVRERADKMKGLNSDIGLQRLVEMPEMEFMPDQVILDSTGNLEFVLDAANSYGEWKNRVQRINERFGVGSMQSTVGLPVDVYFQASSEKPLINRLKENLGYLNFIHDFDTIEKLSAGAARYAADPTKAVALSFQHSWLGPITAEKQKMMITYMARNALGKMYDKESMSAIKETDSSFKYVGATIYRPDIAPGKATVFEVRDAHKNTDLLIERVARTAFFLENGLSSFASAANMPAMNTKTSFEKLPGEVQDMLHSIFPRKTNPNLEYTEAELFAIDVARNFSYPMRDWSKQVEFLGRPELTMRIVDSQMTYVETLTQIRQKLASGEISNKEASLQVQGALCTFVVESGVSEAFKQKNKELLEKSVVDDLQEAS